MTSMLLCRQLRPIAALVAPDGLYFPGDFLCAAQGLISLLVHGSPEPFRVTAPAGRKPLRRWRAARRRDRARVVTDPATAMKKRIGRSLASAAACSLVFMPSFVLPIRRPRPHFRPQAGRRAARLERDRVDHDGMYPTRSELWPANPEALMREAPPNAYTGAPTGKRRAALRGPRQASIAASCSRMRV